MAEYLSTPTLAGDLDDDGILTLTISREDQKNALDTVTIAAIGEAVSKARDHDAVKAIVITAEGKLFGIGADIPEIAAAGSGAGDMADMLKRGNATYSTIESLPKPVCAAINGIFCLGGSLELALACHLRVASKRVRLGLPEVSLGLIPGYGGTQRLPRLIGRSRAIELILTGEPIKAERAYEIGLVHDVVDTGEEVEGAKKLLKKALKNGPRAIAAVIAAVTLGQDRPLADALAVEAEQFLAVRQTADAAEGLAAQQEGRRPKFTGK